MQLVGLYAAKQLELNLNKVAVKVMSILKTGKAKALDCQPGDILEYRPGY